jgi:hypothetical protein
VYSSCQLLLLLVGGRRRNLWEVVPQ